MQQQLNQMQQKIDDAKQIKGLFSTMVQEGKLVSDGNGNFDINANYVDT